MRFNEAHELMGNRFRVAHGKPGNPKKMTGTRLSKVLNMNRWATDFQAWCEIMRVAEPGFEGNMYTEAGQAIEPKLIDFCKDIVSPYIVSPSEYFSDSKKRWDFFPDNEVFGGMWDALAFDEDGVTDKSGKFPIAVIEAKTTSRPQDWEEGVPEHYKVQGMLYAALLGCSDVYFPVAFLTQDDYENPSEFECTEDNTRVFHVRLDEPVGEHNSIYEAMDAALEWWADFVDGNVSPRYDAKSDEEYLKLIRRCEASDLFESTDADDLEELCASLDELDRSIEYLKIEHGITELEKRRKEVNSAIQKIVKPMLVDKAGFESMEAGNYIFTVSPTRKANYEAMEADGVLEKYVTVTNTIRTKRK